MSESVIQRAEIEAAVERLVEGWRPRLARLWNYYQNPMRACGVRSDGQGSDRPYRQGQEWGLPSRITGLRSGCEVGVGQVIDGVARKEVVVENDIGWRVDTMVDYLFGKGITINSAAPEAGRRKEIGELLRLILSHNGGILFLQQMALIGCVYGFVDVLVKLDLDAGGDVEDPAGFSGVQDLGEAPVSGGEEGAGRAGDGPTQLGRVGLSAREMRRVARMIRLEIVEPARALPFLSGEDWQKLEAYGQVYVKDEGGPSTSSGRERMKDEGGKGRGWWSRWFLGGEKKDSGFGLEVITATGWQRLVGGKVVAEGGNSLGALPVVHIQNLAMPFQYSGASDVEPLIPIQDELNTRLSDRANRITMQSFKMYLGKNIEGFTDATISPGKMWMTDNPDAEVISFGGDMGETASEEEHIADLREAMDKVSGVSPVAAGAIKDRIGNLTSAAALRITMFALLSKNDRKRTTYGGGLQRICELALAWLDCAGVYETEAEERQVEIGWPSPLPENESDALEEAGLKLKVGVPQEVVLRELGY